MCNGCIWGSPDLCKACNKANQEKELRDEKHLILFDNTDE